MSDYHCIQCGAELTTGPRTYYHICPTCRQVNAINEQTKKLNSGGGYVGTPPTPRIYMRDPEAAKQPPAEMPEPNPVPVIIGNIVLFLLVFFVLSLGNWAILKFLWFFLKVGFWLMGGFLFMSPF